MTDRYARSTDGNNADDGLSWNNAKANIASLGMAAGDRGIVSQNHAETQAASVTIALAGTQAAPSNLACGNDAAEPPTAGATTATVSATGANTITFTGHGKVHGITTKVGSGSATSTPKILLGQAAGEVQIYDTCGFWCEGTGAAQEVVLGVDSSIAPSHIIWNQCHVKFGATTQGLRINQTRFEWRGGSVLAGSSAIAGLFQFSNNRGGYALVDGVDLSNMAASMNLVTVATGRPMHYIFRYLKLPASWSGGIFSATPAVGTRGEMYNSDAGDTNIRFLIEDSNGIIKSETTIVRTGGASDGTTPLSWKMTSSPNAEYPTHLLRSAVGPGNEIGDWIDTVGSPVTLTVEIVHDSQGAGSGSKFQDDEIWLEVLYLGTSGFPLGNFISDCKADIFATAANQADSTEAWTTTGLTTPVKQKLSVTFTPEEKGHYHARVVLAKASKTVYVCPKAVLT